MVSGNSFGGRRILVVEDDLLVVADLVDTLHAMGADVIGPIENITRPSNVLKSLPILPGQCWTSMCRDG